MDIDVRFKPYDIVRELSADEPAEDPYTRAIIAIAFERGMLFAHHNGQAAEKLLYSLHRLHSPQTVAAVDRFNDEAAKVAATILGG